MTRVLELSAEQDAVLERKAARAGMSVDDYLKRVVDKITKISMPDERSDSLQNEPKPNSTQDLIDFLQTGVMSDVYSDDIDAPELARKLRKEAERRIW